MAGVGSATNRHPSENGITLAQLRSTARLMKQLCKARLLKFTSEFARNTSNYSKDIKWTEINMHNINQEVILKLIPKSDSCSWVEIVTATVQKPQVFVSHNWSEPFRDFMKSIELYHFSSGIGVHDTFFICTFANNQWLVDLGDTLKESPFYKALLGAEGVVLMLDKMGTALARIWCVFEMKATLDIEKPLIVATPLGVISDKAIQASSMHSSQVVEVLKSVDVAQAQATNPVDQRQIMNSIAGVPELTGLQKDENSCQKTLSDDRKAEEGGALLYKYEEELVKKSPGPFEDLNKFIRNHGKTSTADTAEVGCTVDDPALRSLTLAQIRVMARRVETWCAKKYNIYEWDHLTLQQLIDSWIKEFNESKNKRSYMESVAAGPRPPEFLITVSFSMSVKEFMASLEWHAEARALPASAAYWFMPAATAKQEHSNYLIKNKKPISFEAMKHVLGHAVILDAKGSVLERALPCLEIHAGLQSNRIIDLACSSGALAATRPFTEGFEFGAFDGRLAVALLKFDVAKIKGKDEQGIDHAEMTKCTIAGDAYNGGHQKAPAASLKYDKFNSRIHSKAFGPALRHEEYCFSDLPSTLSDVRVTLTCSSLRGLLGETALHVEAARGRRGNVELLLQHKSDPNAQDNDGETPLHYAAMAGQLDTAEVLVMNGALPGLESYFMETPACVASLNAAAFLKVDTASVHRFLAAKQECADVSVQCPGSKQGKAEAAETWAGRFALCCKRRRFPKSTHVDDSPMQQVRGVQDVLRAQGAQIKALQEGVLDELRSQGAQIKSLQEEFEAARTSQRALCADRQCKPAMSGIGGIRL